MKQLTPLQNSSLSLDDKTERMLVCEEPMDVIHYGKEHLSQHTSSESLTGQEKLTETDAQWMPRNNLLSQLQQSALTQGADVTVAEFVEHKFVPEHVALKEPAGKTHYQAMLRHVLSPEEVDRVFCVNPKLERKRLKAIPEWPYLSNVRLCDACPEHIHRLCSAALKQGYSSQTVVHIRNVVSAIFSHAIRERCFVGDNPVNQVKLPDITRKESSALTFAQVNEILSMMKYPEKEMMLLAIFTELNVSEICGLQWKHVNLSDTSLRVEGEEIPPKTIAVRKQWIRGELMVVKASSIRNLPIPPPILHILYRLHAHWNSDEPDDFVLVSRAGTPVNQTNIVARRLKTVAEKLGVPALSWQVFRRTRKALLSEFGTQFQYSAAIRAASPSSPIAGAYK